MSEASTPAPSVDATNTPATVTLPIAGVPATASAASAAPAAPAAPAAQSPAGQQSDDREPHWLADRLRRTEESARKALLKDLGVEDPKDAKAALAAYKARIEAEKTELQRANEKAASLETAAKERDVYKARVETWAKKEFDSLTDQQKAAVELLAGDDPLKRATAIEALRPTWAIAAPQAPVASAAPAAAVPPPIIPAPANIAPPAAAPRPDAMQSAWDKWSEVQRTKSPYEATMYYQFHQQAIEAARPNA